MKYERPRHKVITALMLSRSCRVGDVLRTHDGVRMVVTQRLTHNTVRCRELTWREVWGPRLKGIATALACAVLALVLMWLAVHRP